jgi:predicted RNA-binding protein with PUA-like domain
MARSFWLVKSEPSEYAYAQLVADRVTKWTGVRNFTARNHLAAMKQGDLALYYHTGDEKAVVGVAQVVGEARPDSTAKAAEGWVAVELAPVKLLAAPVPLATIKADAKLRDLALVRQSRLSVMPIPKPAFERILALAKTKLG